MVPALARFCLQYLLGILHRCTAGITESRPRLSLGMYSLVTP